MSHLENHLSYADFSKGCLILGQPCQDVTTWDVTNIFTFTKSKPTLTDCDLKTLSHRLAIILCLTTAQKEQTIQWFDLDYVKISSDKVALFMRETLKTTRPGYHLPPIELKTFKDSKLCIVVYLKKYIKMTAHFRNSDTNQLSLSFLQPHKPIPTIILSKYCNCNERVSLEYI